MISVNDNFENSDLPGFAEFRRENEGKVYTFAFAFLKSRKPAEDVTREALQRVLRNWNSISQKLPGDQVKDCYRIAAKLSIDTLKKNRAE